MCVCVCVCVCVCFGFLLCLVVRLSRSRLRRARRGCRSVCRSVCLPLPAFAARSWVLSLSGRFVVGRSGPLVLWCWALPWPLGPGALGVGFGLALDILS